MATTYRQKGDVIELTAPVGGVASNDLVQAGSFVGVALNTAAENELYRAQICGVWEVPKLTTDAVTTGAPLYFDAGNGWLTLADGGGANALAGYAWADAGNGVTEVEVKLFF